MKLICGLGNPGKTYTHTRHNIGWRVLDALLEHYGETPHFSQEKWKGLTQSFFIGEEKILLLKPLTYMNLSGQSYSAALQFLKLDPTTDACVVYDDKDLCFGTLRLKTEGSSGGHNGVKSLIEHLGSNKFTRLKCGIGQTEQHIPTAAFVLQNFKQEEENQMKNFLDEAVKQLTQWAHQ